MYNLLKVITLADGVDHDQFAGFISYATRALTGLQSYMFEPTLDGVYNGGDFLWRAVFDDKAVAEAAIASDAWAKAAALIGDPATVTHVDSVAYEGWRSGGSSGGSGLYRVALFCANVRPDADRLAAFGEQTSHMPDHVRSILRWQLSVADHAEGTRPWTHVWEQEYADLDGLNGPYMMHPVHWAHVERWFDTEYPEHLVDTELVHSFCAIQQPAIR